MHALRIEVRIDELAPGGDGVAIANVDGERRAVFVRGVAKGDALDVEADLTHRPARGRVLALLSPGPERVEPACAHADGAGATERGTRVTCGGCDWMHVSPAGQADAHRAHVTTALPAPWREHAIVAHAAKEALGYRSRARLHVRASGGRAIVGMHQAGTREPAEVDACVVLHPALEAGRAGLAALLEGAHGRGEAQIALGAGGRPVLDLRWSGELAPACYGRLERAAREGSWAGARIVCGEATRPANIGDPTPWMRGPDDAPLRLAAGGFAQASESANAELAGRVLALASEVAPPTAPQRIVELYAGAGNFSVLLARPADGDSAPGAQLIAVESSREACEAARANLAARGLSAKVVEADASAYAWSPSTDLVVLDPPRTGARAVAERLAASPVRHVLYVSCDTATLARDLAILEPRYAPLAIETFEMFPQTSHIEALLLLERRRARPSPRAGGMA